MVALKVLEEHGIKVLCIPPNLTHVIQINDHGRINGKIQQRVRRAKATICQQNNNRTVSIERWCYEVESIIWTTINLQSVMAAAKSIGMNYISELKIISMTNESIERAIRDLLGTGRIIRDDEMADREYVVLRERGYVEFLKSASQGTIPYPRLITEQAIRAMEMYSDQLILERTGNSAPPRPRRAYKRVSSSRSSHPGELKVVGDPNNKVAKKRFDVMEAVETARQNRKDEIIRKRKEREQKAAEKQSRFEELQASFREFDIMPFKRSLARYLSGTQSRESAVRILNKKLKITDTLD